MGTNTSREVDAGPVRRIPLDDAKPGPQPGLGLCLSGGGYRAMLFHCGGLIRLKELDFFPRLDRVSSVSGGSITAALLGLHWKRLNLSSPDAGDVVEFVVGPIRSLASRTIDAGSILAGLALPGNAADRIDAAYRKYLFKDATLQDLPDRPRFVINATNVQSMALWRFSKPYMADYRVGKILRPKVALAKVVAASSAFPPVLSPMELDVEPQDFEPGSGMDLQREPFTSQVVLTDGGVYDNLGIETVWKRYQSILVSDGGGKTPAEAEPKRDWARHAVRILLIIDNQVRSMRLRQIIDAFKNPNDEHNGVYWGIRTSIGDYGVPDVLPCPESRTKELAELPTRLRRLDSEYQERLINWGYAICDAGLRSIDRALSKPKAFPYPQIGV